MKKALTPTQGTAAVSEPWRAALRTFDADLQRRGAAERTRRAYGTDAAELAAWATANGLNPQQVEFYNEVMRSLQLIARTVEQYAPPAERQAAPVRAVPNERWGAGEHSDALDDRYQDSHMPLDDRPGRDEQP